MASGWLGKKKGHDSLLGNSEEWPILRVGSATHLHRWLAREHRTGGRGLLGKGFHPLPSSGFAVSFLASFNKPPSPELPVVPRSTSNLQWVTPLSANLGRRVLPSVPVTSWLLPLARTR